MTKLPSNKFPILSQVTKYNGLIGKYIVEDGNEFWGWMFKIKKRGWMGSRKTRSWMILLYAKQMESCLSS